MTSATEQQQNHPPSSKKKKSSANSSTPAAAAAAAAASSSSTGISPPKPKHHKQLKQQQQQHHHQKQQHSSPYSSNKQKEQYSSPSSLLHKKKKQKIPTISTAVAVGSTTRTEQYNAKATAATKTAGTTKTVATTPPQQTNPSNKATPTTSSNKPKTTTTPSTKQPSNKVTSSATVSSSSKNNNTTPEAATAAEVAVAATPEATTTTKTTVVAAEKAVPTPQPKDTETNNNKTATTATDTTRRSRRSARVLEHDPIVAPGFGTHKDLLRLAQQLSSTQTTTTTTTNNTTGSATDNNNNKEKDSQQQQPTPIFSLEAVEIMMNAKGRGVRAGSRRQRGGEDEPAAGADAAAANPWGDFMTSVNDEAVDAAVPSDNTAKGTTAAAGAASSNGGKEASSATKTSSSDNKSDKSPTAAASSSTMNKSAAPADINKKRSYDLDRLVESGPNVKAAAAAAAESTSNSSRKKQKKSKGAAAAVASTEDDHKDGGILLQAGTLDAYIVGRSKGTNARTANSMANCPIPTKIFPTVVIRKVFTSCNSVHSVAVDISGNAYGWGRNEANQLGPNLPFSTETVGDGKMVALPTLLDLPGGSKLHMAAMGKSHTLFLMQDGSMWATGANKVGQCGVRSWADLNVYKKCVLPDDMVASDAHFVQVACGEDFSMAIDSNGNLFSCGSSEFGQLGNGETGEYFVAANKLAYTNANVFTIRTNFCHAPNEKLHMNNEIAKVSPIVGSTNIRIQAVACGKHHTVALEAASDQNPRVFTWGCGNYGCLGHGVQADEYFPRQVGTLNSVSLAPPPVPSTTTNALSSSVKVTAGAHCSLVQTGNGHVYYWGKHRSVGEAMMRPQLVDVLANNQHVVQHIGAGGQTVVCSTSLAQTVAWGQGPYGELGLGAPKSSSKPTFVEVLNGCTVLDLACGYGQTLYVVKDEIDPESAVHKLHVLDPVAVEVFKNSAKELAKAAPKKKVKK